MAANGYRTMEGILLVFATSLIYLVAGQQCTVPQHLQGNYFSMEAGEDVETTININTLERSTFRGSCVERLDDHSNEDADNRYDSQILLLDSNSDCYMCYELRFRTLNVVQYKYSTCASTKSNGEAPSLEEVCGTINDLTEYYTYFRKEYETVNCKNTFEGVYNFSYEWNYGGGGICHSPDSGIVACQLPGSQYLDNEVFEMNFGECPGVSTTVKRSIRFLCLGTWQEGNKIWSAVSDMGQDIFKEKYRCLLTTHGQEEGDNKVRYTMSWFADCSELKSPYDGPMRLLLQPVVGESQLASTQPECNFPTNFSGHWFHAGEWDVDVDINATHIYFRTKIDEFNYREAYFICLMNSGTRFLALAITVGKCEIDYMCFDMLPRHHSIVRWRMGKPYRLDEVDRARPDFKSIMFHTACSWYSFTLDREDIDWNYKTFLLNPPVPIECPIRGRYRFKQSGPSTELIQTRIRGMTERPRHMIDCLEYVSEWKSCDDNPTKISLDAEYCETVDHTGRPIGEYDLSDWELTCVGYWGEDWTSYMITWDPEDPTSAFRCWAYERNDWRFISVSRSTTAFCRPDQHPRSSDPAQGASLQMELSESERLFDDCAQDYKNGNPWTEEENYISSRQVNAASSGHHVHLWFLVLPLIAVFLR